MMQELLAAIEGSALAVYLRNSVWAYPLVNTGHIVGVALLVGSSVPIGLRFLGLWKFVPEEGLRRVLNRIADAGFAIAVVCGLLLFSARALSYAESAVFRLKLTALCVALVLTIGFRILAATWSSPRGEGAERTRDIPLRIRFTAGASVVAWLAVLTLGRLIGYF